MEIDRRAGGVTGVSRNRYGVSIRFRFRFFKYLLYSRVLVLLVFLYSKLKLLLSAG